MAVRFPCLHIMTDTVGHRVASVFVALGLAGSGCPTGFDSGVVWDSAPPIDSGGTAVVTTSNDGGTASSDGSSAGSTGAPQPAGDCAALDAPLGASEQMLVDMPADSWLRVAQGYRSVCDDAFELEWHSVAGCAGVINDWSGGVWDPVGRQLLLWGGGTGYAGNEVYAFSAASFTWSRLTEPSPGPYSRDPLDDGRPVSRQTYNGLAWVDHLDAMLGWGGARAQDGVATDVTWLFDPAQALWTQPAGRFVPASGYEVSMVYDPATGHVLTKLPSLLYDLDPATNTWTMVADLGFPPDWPRYYGGSPSNALDTERRLAWFVGGGQYLVWDIDQGMAVTDDWVTTGGGMFDNGLAEQYPEQAFVSGGGDVISQPDPGFAYDARTDQMMAWVGGGPYELDLDTKVWTRRSGTDAPVAALARGTFGRWRYVCAYNVFILVTSMDDVYFYKHTAGA